jgi:hypothetical protein
MTALQMGYLTGRREVAYANTTDKGLLVARLVVRAEDTD